MFRLVVRNSAILSLLANINRCRGRRTLSRLWSSHAIFRRMTSALSGSAGTKCHISWNLMPSGKQRMLCLKRLPSLTLLFEFLTFCCSGWTLFLVIIHFPYVLSFSAVKKLSLCSSQKHNCCGTGKKTYWITNERCCTCRTAVNVGETVGENNSEVC